MKETAYTQGQKTTAEQSNPERKIKMEPRRKGLEIPSNIVVTKRKAKRKKTQAPNLHFYIKAENPLFGRSEREALIIWSCFPCLDACDSRKAARTSELSSRITEVQCSGHQFSWGQKWTRSMSCNFLVGFRLHTTHITIGHDNGVPVPPIRFIQLVRAPARGVDRKTKTNPEG